ncbi:hypothetical protein HDU85_002975 [Gaertneriomyces sp. JEL0708]|nr:hypothetical protein HDU85_002975 [Gaertneriomyces sp. JEL0708]
MPFQLHLGGELPSYTLAYETWGQLNADKSNGILLFTGLSASSHASSTPENPQPGWWEEFIGPSKALDTDKFFVICANVLGGCYGSTGPSSIDPTTGKRYATRFPYLTLHDIASTQFQLLSHLGIEKLHAVVGSSMGGCLAVASAAMFPDRISRVVSISGAARSHPYSIALRYVQRQVLMADSFWKGGDYYDGVPPHVGLKLARQVATITYRSGPEWERRFGRRGGKGTTFCPEMAIETYLDHQGDKWCLEYDANSMLYLSKAMDIFDMGSYSPLGQERQKDTIEVTDSKDIRPLVKALAPITHPTLVLGVQSDLLFPVWQQKEIATALRGAGNKRVTYYELDAMYGHDTFLIDVVGVGDAVRGHLEGGL